MKIVLTGGGTGGHAYPAISIAEALRALPNGAPDCELLYLGSRDSLEARLAASAGIPFVGLTGRKLRKVLSPGSILTAAALAAGFVQALRELRRFKPDLVIGTGGYASAAVVLAQALRRGKTLIHEQNMVPGRTNLWLSRFATRICVTFEDSIKYFPSGKTFVTGLPVRSELLSLPAKEKARAALGLEPGTFTILVLGGSQGAQRLNEVVAESVPDLSRLPVQLLHQTGQRNHDEAARRRESVGWDRYHLRAYFDDMRPVYAAADLVVSRCGASTVAEITAVGLPAILVPYPYAYADHQRLNGEFLADKDAAIVVTDADLSAERLTSAVRRLVESPAELKKMADASRGLGKPGAAGDIAMIAVEMVNA